MCRCRPLATIPLLVLGAAALSLGALGCGASLPSRGRPVQELQRQIDALNERLVSIEEMSAVQQSALARCRQPVLKRSQVELLTEAREREGEDAGFSVGAMLSMSPRADRSAHEAFLSRYLARAGSVEEFWNSLEEEGEPFTAEVLDDIRYTLLLARVADHRLGVLEGLRVLREEGELSSLRDLANLDRSKWRGLFEDETEDPDPYLRTADRVIDAFLFGGC